MIAAQGIPRTSLWVSHHVRKVTADIAKVRPIWDSTGTTGKVSQNHQKGRDTKDQLKMMDLNEYEWI